MDLTNEEYVYNIKVNMMDSFIVKLLYRKILNDTKLKIPVNSLDLLLSLTTLSFCFGAELELRADVLIAVLDIDDSNLNFILGYLIAIYSSICLLLKLYSTNICDLKSLSESVAKLWVM